MKKIYLLTLLLVGFVNLTKAQVVVSAMSGGTNLCVGSGSYTTLGTLTLTETTQADFPANVNNVTYFIDLPSGNFQYDMSAILTVSGASDPTGDFKNGGQAPSAVVTSTSRITLTYSTDATADKTDVLTISGIKVRAVTSPAFGNIISNGNSLGIPNWVNHGTLFSVSSPVVSLIDNDADNIVCTSGSTNVTFTAFGASNYEFFVNGVSIQNSASSTFNYNWSSVPGTNPQPVYVRGTTGGCSSQSSTTNMTINATPSLDWNSLFPTSFTLADADNTLNSNGIFNVNPGGGSYVFSGTGVSSSGGNYKFSPSAAGAGAFSINCQYTVSGCSASDAEVLTVNAPNTISGLNSNYCIDGGGSWLSISPPGIKNVVAFQYYNFNTLTFTNLPNYVAGNTYFFSPAYYKSIGGALSSGDFGFCYVMVLYNDGSTSPYEYTYVYDKPSIGLIPIGSLCDNSGLYTLSFSPPDNGNVNTFFTGTGVSETSPGVWKLNPSIGGTGPRDITYSYKSNTGAQCTNDTTISVVINSKPTVTITPGSFAPEYCTNSAEIIPLGNQSPAGYFSGPGIYYDFADFKYKFKPSFTTTGVKRIYYTYSAGTGCSNSDSVDVTIADANSINLSLSTSDTAVCLPLVGNGTYRFEAALSGLATGINWTAYNGLFYTTGGNAGTFGTAIATPGYTDAVDFTNSIFQAGNNRAAIRVTSTGGPATCPQATKNFVAFLIPPPSIKIEGLTKDKFCQSEPNFTLQGKATYKYPFLGTLITSSNTVTNFTSIFPIGDPALVGSVFQPFSAATGNHDIRYSYTDPNGCTNFNDTTIVINENPIAEFIIDSGRCATQFTFFNANPSNVVLPNHSYIPPAAASVTYSWDFGDGTTLADTSNIIKPKYKFPFPGGYPVSLSLLTDQGCSNTKTLTGANLLTIQQIPKSDFDFRFVCQNDVTIFDTLSTVAAGSFKSRTWIFKNSLGVPFDTIYQTTSAATTKGFVNPGNYFVTVIDSTTLGCRDSRTRKVFILPYVTPTVAKPYAVNFKDSSGFWSETGINSTWKHAIPDAVGKPLMNYGGSGVIDSVWVTSDTGRYSSGEKSHLNSPCFNFSQLSKPMVSIKLWTATQDQIAGAVLNVSTDNGLTWNTVGKLGDGLDWYNNIGIAGSPGNVSTNDGWSGVDTTWRQAKIGLPAFANYNPASKVRFRVTFGAPSDTSIARSEGIAIDSVWIGNKNKVVLVEHFTNYNTTSGTSNATTTPSIALADNSVSTIRDTRKNDVAPIYYHASFPNSDSFNSFYPAGPSSRVLFYGVGSAPKTVLDGNNYNGSIYTGGTPDTRLDVKDVDARSLETANFAIDLTTSFTPGIANIGARVIYIGKNMFSKDVVVQTVVTEDDSTGTVKYGSIARQMLPDAAGNYISRNWVPNDTVTFGHIWNHSLPATAKLNAVVFVQDATTKEVYQAAFFRGSGSTNTPVVLGVEENSEKEEFNVRMFPNPATDEVFFIFGKALRHASEWEIMDNLGRTVGTGVCSAGKEGFSINIGNYTGGIYHIKVKGDNGTVVVKELVVIH